MGASVKKRWFMILQAYKNSWYVEKLSEISDNYWITLLDSVGNKSYATGYLNALDSMYPSATYRLIDKNGKVAKEIAPKTYPTPATSLNKIKCNKAKCLKCGDIIESKHRHDYVSCKCGAISVDGGKDYLKRSWGSSADYMELSEYEKEKL